MANIENKQNLPSYPATSNNAAFINKNLYVEESVKVLEQIILKADPLLQELASIVKEFEDKSDVPALIRDQELIKKYGQSNYRDKRRRLRISFSSLKEL